VRHVWMDADRYARFRPERLDAAGLGRFFGMARRENHQRTLETGALRARDYVLEVAGESLVGEMTV